MFLIGTKLGIIRDHALINNKYHQLKYTQDVREAKTWLSWQDAWDFLYKAGAVNALPHYASYAVIMPFGKEGSKPEESGPLAA